MASIGILSEYTGATTIREEFIQIADTTIIASKARIWIHDYQGPLRQGKWFFYDEEGKVTTVYYKEGVEYFRK